MVTASMHLVMMLLVLLVMTAGVESGRRSGNARTPTRALHLPLLLALELAMVQAALMRQPFHGPVSSSSSSSRSAARPAASKAAERWGRHSHYTVLGWAASVSLLAGVVVAVLALKPWFRSHRLMVSERNRERSLQPNDPRVGRGSRQGQLLRWLRAMPLLALQQHVWIARTRRRALQGPAPGRAQRVSWRSFSSHRRC